MVRKNLRTASAAATTRRFRCSLQLVLQAAGKQAGIFVEVDDVSSSSAAASKATGLILRGQKIPLPRKDLGEGSKWVLERYTGARGEAFAASGAPSFDAVGFSVSVGLLKQV
mmetsp:Transcript_19073/g.47709  ORF Transcript_19073/g.47709 Transcript_19073/m.47709 type:complete len:112 (-) Transcript_19073:212-547(-)